MKVPDTGILYDPQIDEDLKVLEDWARAELEPVEAELRKQIETLWDGFYADLEGLTPVEHPKNTR